MLTEKALDPKPPHPALSSSDVTTLTAARRSGTKATDISAFLLCSPLGRSLQPILSSVYESVMNRPGFTGEFFI